MKTAAENPWAQKANTDTLTKLWGEGYSAGWIAEAIGGVSRAAVLGKLFRLGLMRHGLPIYARPQRKRKPKARRGSTPFNRSAPPMRPAPPPPVPVAADIIPLHLDIFQLTADTCRFPYGEGPYTYCGHPIQPERPYCPSHCAIAYVPLRRAS